MEIKMRFAPGYDITATASQEEIANILYLWSCTEDGRLPHMLGALSSEYAELQSKGLLDEEDYGEILNPRFECVDDRSQPEWTIMYADFGDDREWFFLHKGNYVPIPTGCKVNREGVICVRMGERTANVSQQEVIWPRVLFNPLAYVAVRDLGAILSGNSDNSNLTALTETSQQPHRKTSKDLRKELQQIYSTLCFALSS